MRRAFYFETISDFLSREDEAILGRIVANNPNDLNDLQKNSWIAQIRILKNSLDQNSRGALFFEYSIPRMGKRVDAVVIQNGIIFLLEFKVGAPRFDRYAIDK